MRQEQIAKLLKVKDYLSQHPECSVRSACRIFNVCHVAYHRFKKNGCHGKTKHELKREMLAPLTLKIYEEDGSKPGAKPICQKLNATGYHCSVPTVLSIAQELGISYRKYFTW